MIRCMKSSNFKKLNIKYLELCDLIAKTFENTVNLLTETNCIVCGKRSYGKRLCNDCSALINDPPSITPRRLANLTLYYFGFYEGKLRDFILSYKFNNHHSLAKTFAVMIRNTLIANGINPDIITYVPATKSAKKKRGYDHMRLIASQLSDLTSVDLVDALKAVRETDQLKTSDRSEAVKGKFQLAEKSYIIKDKNVLLVDDVLTTGSTIMEASKVLKTANPKNLFVCVIALNK